MPRNGSFRIRKHFRPGNSNSGMSIATAQKRQKMSKGNTGKQGYQYVPMINTLPHPNKALVFPCPLRQSVRQWQLRPLSYNVHQLLSRVLGVLCRLGQLRIAWELLAKAWLDYLDTFGVRSTQGCCISCQGQTFKAPATRRTRDLWVP